MDELLKAKPVVLVVDDTADNLMLMNNLLKDLYKVKVANSGERALQIVAAAEPPDLILLDIMMPGMDGFEVCRTLKANPESAAIPVIFLTAKVAVEDEELGFSLGAVDFISKPISPPVLLARVKTQLAMKSHVDFLRDNNAFLQAEVEKRTRDIMAIQDVTILAMASLAETRDSDTGNHIRRTQHYVRLLAKQLQTQPKFAPLLSDETIELLYKSAPLHDIGKVGIPDRILLKPGKFEGNEFDIMKTHTTLGWNAITYAENALGAPVAFLRLAKEIALYHQEKWDGSGYPEGLRGEEIPLSARLMALADVYDALISRRIYKEGMSHDKARTIILQGAGSHFDPDIVAAFVAVEQGFIEIARRYADSDADLQAKAAQLEQFASQR